MHTAPLLRKALPTKPPLVAWVSLAASVLLHLSLLAWMGLAGSGPISAEAAGHESILSFTLPAEPSDSADVPAEPEPQPQPELQPDQLDPPPAPPADELAALPPEPAVDLKPTPPPAPPPPPAAKPAPASPPPRAAATAPADRPTVFAGVQARRALRIVYVVDASGPMASSMAFVKEELMRSIGALGPDQSFQVLFFRETPGSAAGARAFEAFDARSASPQLAAATPDVKKRLRAWMSSIRPTGRSSPQPALEEAMRLGPDLVFVLGRRIKRTNLSDSASEVRQVLAALDRLNPQNPINGKRPVVIKTIQFLDDDPSGLFQAIAQSHGDGAGSYRLLTLDQLPRR
ncbi:MAG: hypothetical protein GIKADHBN_02457 [Phycisphaerales bacterium]|nr:hypothetical protein [Phycisphaerales bacterium]